MENLNQGKWKEINPLSWKPENTGDIIEGVLLSKTPSKNYDNQVYEIETANGEQKRVFGTTVLDNRMTFVNVGDNVRITYKGTEKNKKDQDVKIFKVEKQDRVETAQ